MGQLSKQAPERPPTTLPSDIVPNPKEEYKAIHLRSGKVTGLEAKVSEEPVKKEALEEAKSQEEHSLPRHPDNPFLVDILQYSAKPKAPKYKPKMLYPQRLQKASKDKQFSRFLEAFKKLQINISFAEALEKMPLYAKFMKELLTNKRNWKESETMVLIKECSAIIQKDLSEKMQDPRSFFIPCTIGDITIQRALCDLGVSINFIPLSLMRKLQIDEVKSTRISLQLADHSIKFPLGVIENLVVKVVLFIFPADFVILDMEEDNNACIILGRPFLAT
ncbi:uncharacterized protein LOC130956957 [Arachis stenosperma]|uniref:uncharacterized protein LOC130956957 n=1 Tax=Arachis stenosperma TaxID=217475 RepID=UPI0025AB62A9|nr:uncharacterized protein LOC130956957 [Arachis stenosperma]